MLVADTVVSFGKKKDVVHHVRKGALAAAGTVEAQEFSGQDRVADVSFPFVVTAHVFIETSVRQSLSPESPVPRAFSTSRYAGTRSVSARSVYVLS